LFGYPCLLITKQESQMKHYTTKVFLFLFLIYPFFCLNAQHVVKIKSEETLHNEHWLKSIDPVQKSEALIPYFHMADLNSKSDFELSITAIEHGSPKLINPANEDDQKESLRSLKANSSRDPFNLIESEISGNIALVNGFEGNSYNNWYPSDNAMAISNDGYIVSLSNSSISFYNAGGVVFLNSQSLGQFYDFLDLGYFFFDPRITYDAEADRFIVVCLYSNSPSTNRVVVSVSASGNPLDGWFTTTIQASEIEAGAWFDYPNLGVSGEDIFISGNMFTSNAVFTQSVIIQLDKDAFYNNEPTQWEIFGDISDGMGTTAFTIKPMSSGLQSDYESQLYLISTNPYGGTTFSLYKITGAVESDQSLEVYSIPTEEYTAAIEASQNGTNKKLYTGGVRIRDGFYAEGKVHFVHTTNFNNGFAGIRYTRIDIENFESYSISYGLEGFDYAYPSIAAFETTGNQFSVLISCLRSGQSLYPEIQAFKVDKYMNSTNSILIKSGESPISISNNTNQRWGDYTSTVKQFGVDEPTVWVFGCYGKDMKFGNFIGEVSLGNNGNAPLSDFIATNTFGTGPLTVSYSDAPSSAVENRFWSFPGGEPAYSTEANPFVVYSEPGSYDVTLTVSNAYGTHQETKYDFVQVGTLPDADIQVSSQNVTVDENVIFQGLSSTEVEEWEWIIEGANVQYHTVQNPVVVFEQPGVYSVELTVTNAFGSYHLVKEDFVEVNHFITGLAEPKELEKFIVYPNPAGQVFRLDMHLMERMDVQIILFDNAGKQIRDLFDGMLKPGVQRLSFNSSVLSNGVYYLVVKDKSGKILSNEKIIIKSP
jgi:PKD repeat protein